MLDRDIINIKIGSVTVNVVCRDDDRPHHDPIVAQRQGVPVFSIGDKTMSAGFSLPFDEIATVQVFAVRASGAKTGIIPGSTVTSDSVAVVVTLSADGTSYTATAATNVVGTTANIMLSPPAGSTIPIDTAVVTIAAALQDPIVSQLQDTANAVLTPNPAPPTA